MAEESIGTYRVDIIANASDLEAEVKKAKTLVQSMGPDFEKSYSKMTRAQQRATMQALKLEQNVGKTKDEIKLLAIAARGAAPDAVEKLRLKLQQAGKTAEVSATQLNKYGMSSKQTAMAMRMVPAQITDIVTGLVSGQRPFMVAIQQGGQLKDIFGGIAPAARALGSAFMSMVNPATLTAGALIGLIALWAKGSTQMDDLRQHLITTGNEFGTTVSQVYAMATAMDQMAGITEGQAVAALTEVVKSGKVAGDQMQTVAAVAARSANLLGRETSEVVEEFSKLAEKPSEAAAELNEKYNFLTAAVYDQIRALEDQGRTQEAAKLATAELARVTNERLDDVQRSLGFVERAWNTVKSAAKEAWDAFAGFGRPSTLAEQLSVAEAKLEQLQDGAYQRGAARRVKQVEEQRAVVQSLREQLQAEQDLAQKNAATAAAEKARIEMQAAARQAWDEQTEHFKTLAQQRADDIADAKRHAALIGATEEELAKRIQQINDEYDRKASRGATKPKARKTSAKTEDPLGDFIKAIGPAYSQYEAFIGKVSGEADRERAQQQRAWLDQAVDVGRITYEQYAQAMDKIADKGENTMGQLGEFTLEAARNIQDSLGDNLYDLLKGNFDDIGDAFEDTLLRMVANAASTNLSAALFGDFDKSGRVGGIVGSVGKWLGSGFAELMANNSSDPIGALINYLPNAKGNVFASRDLSQLSNQIINSPHFFRFARGAGVAGEAGPEAILPLKRGPDGNLGVRAVTGQSAAPNVAIEIVNNGQPVRATQQGTPRFDGKRWVIGIVLDEARNSGQFRDQMRNALAR